MTAGSDGTRDELRQWVAEQVDQFAALRPRYEVYGDVLDRVLRRAVGQIAPLAMVQTRVKSTTSFAEKALRKRAKRTDPVHQFTDLCGARVIGRTRAEVDALCTWVVDRFDVDWENSVDTSERLAPTEFGYRSVHYIVSLRDDVEYGVPVPPEALGLKAEIQLRTVAEHAYCDFAHDLTYKGAFALPVGWQRELAGAAATLEEVDTVFSRIQAGLHEYASTYGRLLLPEELAAEVDRLEIVLAHDPTNAELADRIARLAIEHGDWDKVITVLDPFVGDDPTDASPAVVRDLGIAVCQLHRAEPGGGEYRRGQALLEAAAAHDDLDAICAYAGTWKGLDDRRARDLYRRAYELDPADPYALGNYLELELDRDPALLESVGPLVRQGIERCRRHLDAGINLPWALYDLGRFHLLLDEPYEALSHYAHAVSVSGAAFMVETSLRSLERMAPALGHSPGVEWARRLLLLGLAAHFPSDEHVGRVRALATPGVPPLRAPVVILAGGTDRRVQTQIETYRSLVTQAMAGFEGTVLSGGTTEGISGLVGEVGRDRGDAVTTVGYLPEFLPADATVDHRYDELRRTDGQGFSAAEPLQNWVDLVASGIQPRTVRVVGINGGRIAAAEYRIALALGATVGLVADSGREAGRLLSEERWSGPAPVRLPPDPEALRALLVPQPPPWDEPVREQLARAVHETYRQERLRDGRHADRALLPWDALPGDLRASNLQQADHIVAKLARIGCTVAPADAPGEPVGLSDEDVEVLAEMEHGRWMVERLLAGWRWGPTRDPARRESLFIVEWSRLPEDVKQLDRDAVRSIPDLLASVGLGIRRGADA